MSWSRSHPIPIPFLSVSNYPSYRLSLGSKMRSLCQPLLHLAFLLSITLVVARYDHHPLLRARSLYVRDALLSDILYPEPGVLRTRDAYALPLTSSVGGGVLPYDPARNQLSPERAAAAQSQPGVSTPQAPPAMALTPPTPQPAHAQLPPGQGGPTMVKLRSPAACVNGCDPASNYVAAHDHSYNPPAPIHICADCDQEYPVGGRGKRKRSLGIMLARLGYLL